MFYQQIMLATQTADLTYQLGMIMYHYTTFLSDYKVSLIITLSVSHPSWFGSRQFVPSSPRSTLDSLFFNFQGSL